MVGSKTLGRRTLTIYLPLAFFVVFLLFPFYWMSIVSLKPTNDLFELEIQPLLDPALHPGELSLSLPEYRLPRMGEEHASSYRWSPPLSPWPAVFSSAMPWPGCGFPGVKLPGRGDLPGLPGAADPAFPAALPGDRQAGSVQYVLGAHPHLSDAAHSLRLLAAHGLFPDDPQRDRGVRHGRRLHPDGNPGQDHPAACPCRG